MSFDGAPSSRIGQWVRLGGVRWAISFCGRPEVITAIGRRRVLRSEVLVWERRRAAKVLRMLGLPDIGDASADHRNVIAEHKLQLGHEQVEALLSRQLRLSTWGVGVLARLSGGRRALSTVGLAVNRGTASDFLRWWDAHVVTSDEALLAVCPDHWSIRPGPHGWQEVVETTGGSPLASRLFIDYQDITSLHSQRDPAYPHQIAAVARLNNGTPIGGLRHQLRDTAQGFDMTLIAEFPAVTPPTLVAGHRWHLACEFSNMIELALANSLS